jgi:hypothetical protein
MQLDALKRLAITEFEEKYTEATVDKILEEIWMSPVDRELYKNLIPCAIFLRSCANLFFSSLRPCRFFCRVAAATLLRSSLSITARVNYRSSPISVVKLWNFK